MLLTSDGYCYSEEGSHDYVASVVGSQFLALYRQASRASGRKRVLLVLDVHREHAESGNLFGSDGALKHFWYDIACLKLARKHVRPIWGLEASDEQWEEAVDQSRVGDGGDKSEQVGVERKGWSAVTRRSQ